MPSSYLNFHSKLGMVRSGIMALTLTLVLGCSSNGSGVDKSVDNTEFKKHYSGFLTQNYYNKLKEYKSPSDNIIYRYISPNLSPENYDAAIIDPVTFYPKATPTKQVSQATLDQLKTNIRALVSTRMAEVLPVTETAGPRVFRVQFAITGVEVGEEGLSTLEHLPIGLVFAGVSGVTGNRPEYVRLYLESKAIDSETGEILAAGVREITGEGLDNAREQLQATKLDKGMDMASHEFVRLWKTIWNK